MLNNKSPEFNGSMDYLERCGDLMRAYHNAMVMKAYSDAINITQELHSELLPWMNQDQAEKCAEFEKKALNQLGTHENVKEQINVRTIHNWFRKLNMIFHQTGLGMKSKNINEDVWVI